MFVWEEPNAFPNHFVSGYDRNMLNREHGTTMMSYSTSSSSSSLGYIEHTISKLDTLAGIAIKYGVEVADVKKINGLVNDRQMFALKILHIPLAGRHSPSICLPDGSSTTTGSHDHHACHQQPFESFQSKRLKKSSEQLSPAMIPLQDCYVTKPTMKKSMSQVFEMTVYKVGSSNSSENGCSAMPERPLSHKKSRSLVDEILDDVMGRSNISPLVEDEEDDSDQLNDALVQRDKKLEGNFNTTTPEWLLTQDNSCSGWISPTIGKGLAQRQKATLRSESESNGINPVLMGMKDASGIRKSSSTSLLQENIRSSSFRRTSRCSSRSDLQASSTATSAKPTIDGLTKPITGRRIKAALD